MERNEQSLQNIKLLHVWTLYSTLSKYTENVHFTISNSEITKLIPEQLRKIWFNVIDFHWMANTNDMSDTNSLKSGQLKFKKKADDFQTF